MSKLKSTRPLFARLIRVLDAEDARRAVFARLGFHPPHRTTFPKPSCFKPRTAREIVAGLTFSISGDWRSEGSVSPVTRYLPIKR